MPRRRTAIAANIAIGIDNFGARDPVAPESYSRSQSNPNIDWPELVSKTGENSRLTIQTPNGTAHEFGNGENQTAWESWNNKANGPKWSGRVDWNRHGKVNRTGE